jgi:hypothetical protein
MPTSARKVKDNVIAKGETTGHSHRVIGAKVFRSNNLQLLVEVPESATLVHEEHAPIQIDKGVYEVIRQREYNPIGELTVND